MPLFTYSQKSADPCCGIIGLNPSGTVIVRNNTTGQTFLFKADELDYPNLKTGDAVSYDAASRKVTGIKGIMRSYAISQPDPIEPCCGITTVKLIPGEPCCGAVGIHNNSTNQDYTIKVDKSILSQLKVGQSVYRLETSGGDNAGPVDGDKAAPVRTSRWLCRI